MQFAGQRTDENLKPIGEPDNVLVRLADDVLPEPDAILVHKVTPQKTLEEGLSEAEFSAFFIEKVALADTVFIGYNNIRFDDEFMRFALYRSFHDPYQWHWQDGKSRWDLLDAVRMMRALRPEGLQWPTLEGKPTVKLELMAKENGLLHENAHDALSDVQALVQLAKMFKEAQPKLFTYLLEHRDKKKVASLVLAGEPFVYTSGKYSSEHEKTTVVTALFKHPRREAAIVYDLREDPRLWFDKTAEELVTHWQVRYGDDLQPLPLKTMQFNRCPAIAPMSVLDEQSHARIGVDMNTVRQHEKLLLDNKAFIEKLTKALDIIENKQQESLFEEDVDRQLYDAFWTPADQSELSLVRATEPKELTALISHIKNKRIRALLPRYQARNYPKTLSAEQREEWEGYRRKHFYSGGEKSLYARFSRRMQEIATTRQLSEHEQYLMTELQLYAESILPEPESD
jgi:exodeoxyribonuclease-1